jgi:hypothetical protein
MRRRPDRRLRRPVQIPERRRHLVEANCQLAAQGFAAAEDPHVGIPGPSRLDEHLPERRCRLHHGGAYLDDRVGQRGRIRGHAPADEGQARSDDQRKEQLEAGDVEGDRRDGEQDVGLGEAGLDAHRAQEVCQCRVRNGHSLACQSIRTCR